MNIFKIKYKIFFCLLAFFLNIFTREKENMIIETERLVLRSVHLADTDSFYEFMSDPEVEKFTGMFNLHKDPAESYKFIQNALDGYEKNSETSWAIIYKPENKVIGIIALYHIKDYKAELAYAISRQYWNLGITTEATKVVVDFGFNILNFYRIEATADPRNGASLRVLEKSGFQREGLLRNYYFFKNEICNRIMFSITKEEHDFKKILI